VTDADALLGALRRRGWTLAVAESLTGGALADAFVRVPGASAVLVGAVVAYATPLKASVLGVDAELLRREGPVHPDVATQMADGVRRALAVDGRPADVGVATTGVAGPEPQGGQPPGTVYVAVATPAGAVVRRVALDGDRAAVRAGAVLAALGLLGEAVPEE
jgi:nicotinamide-nucleotide amidase